jgi:hypothetical protein
MINRLQGLFLDDLSGQLMPQILLYYRESPEKFEFDWRET